jgi:hypothetical protein
MYCDVHRNVHKFISTPGPGIVPFGEWQGASDYSNNIYMW